MRLGPHKGDVDTMTTRIAPCWPAMGWIRAGTELAIGSQQVIAMRIAMLAGGGPAAEREATLMVVEKVRALIKSQTLMAKAVLHGRFDGGAEPVMALYLRRVGANKRRLARRGGRS